MLLARALPRHAPRDDQGWDTAEFFVALTTAVLLGIGGVPSTVSPRVAVTICAAAVLVALGVA